jgi:putative ABC transport system permease protein
VNYLEAFRSALESLRANILRSVLTMLGIFIGVAAVIAMVAVGDGARAQILSQIQSLGSNIITVVTGNVTVGGVRQGLGSRITLTTDDAIALEREISSIELAAPFARASRQVIVNNVNWQTPLFGVTPAFFIAREWDVVAGRLFASDEMNGSSKVALIGQTVVQNLFGDEDPVGKTIRIGNVPVTIIGVLAQKGQTTSGQDQDDAVLVPLWTAKRMIFGINPAAPRSVGTILVKVREGENMQEAEQQIREVLRQRHRLAANQEDDFWTRNLTEVAQTREASARTLALLLAAVAAVSLLVGGIGVMNIMLVSVTERTREIGVRMAVGARRRDVLLQFLIEATTLALLGGVGGVILGIIAARICAQLAGWPTLVQADAIMLAVGSSAAVGIFFGFYPARRAAALDPIEALRHE